MAVRRTSADLATRLFAMTSGRCSLHLLPRSAEPSGWACGRAPRWPGASSAAAWPFPASSPSVAGAPATAARASYNNYVGARLLRGIGTSRAKLRQGVLYGL